MSLFRPLNDFPFDEPPGASDPMTRYPVLLLQKSVDCGLTEPQILGHLPNRHKCLLVHLAFISLDKN